MKIQYLYLSILVIAIGYLMFAAFTPQTSPGDELNNKNIIKFSHKLHADVTDCASCHTAVPTSTSLSDRLLPNHDNCSTCHDVSDEKNCTTCHYDGVYEELNQPKTEIIFNHSFHLDKQSLKCENCHKGVTDVEYAEDAEQPNPIMENCYSCHNDTKVATNACEACHTSTADLLPQSHKSIDFMDTHRFAAQEIDANCIMCHNENNNSCETCHDATSGISEKNNASDFYQPYAPNNFVDGAKQQQITRVHQLNYRFTHGIDAKLNSTECQSCHQIETFCVKCHASEKEDYALGGVVPLSHIQPNFTTLGVGSGGGEHAVLARRDIESCVSCHDVQGADPTCITCHLDSDGIKGTNPKTHPAGFMHDIHGDWHDSAGSICFNCHTSASPSTPAGIGFCGYCHGAKN